MNILTKRNGIALVAVMAILLVLTLLLPIMFSMSENAMEAAMTGSDEQKASYLARSMIEFAVGAFQMCYDGAEADEEKGVEVPDDLSAVDENSPDLLKLKKFLKIDKKMSVTMMYMYRDETVPFPDTFPKKNPNESDADFRERVLKSDEYKNYLEKGIIYSTTTPAGFSVEDVKKGKVPYGHKTAVTNGLGNMVNGSYMGYATCDIVYNDSIDYYRTSVDATTQSRTTEKIKDDDPKGAPATQYSNYLQKAKTAIKNGDDLTADEQIFKVENNRVEFTSYGNINGKGVVRSCYVILPTKPSEKSWIVPANIESNQIFPDTDQASGVTALSINNDSFFEGDMEVAINGQPVYGFSCIGNMVLSTKKIKYKAAANDFLGLAEGTTMDYVDYIDAYNAKVDDYNTNTVDPHNDAVQKKIDNDETLGPDDVFWEHMQYINSNIEDFSLGLHPETTTVNPERDPFFNCLKTQNMRNWAEGARRDNFVAFTATNGIQIDMPVNVIMNPCRTGRIGDGIASNQSLYKVLYLQAPDIVFNNRVNSFVSLYTKNSGLAYLLDYNAYRMSTIILAAPESTPYTMEILKNPDNPDDGIDTVKAGRVYFAEDAYIWLVPFTENGSNYKTQTVYYKGKDVILYKFANAGDVYQFNAEKETKINGEMKKAGFSMTSYFMDVIYSKEDTDTNNTPWWNLWSGIQNLVFDTLVDRARPRTYDAQDLQWIGNMNAGTQSQPKVDDFYVVWAS